MRNVTFRVGMWAAAGLLIAMGWGLYFATAEQDHPHWPSRVWYGAFNPTDYRNSSVFRP
jgi:hypothetical protein